MFDKQKNRIPPSALVTLLFLLALSFTLSVLYSVTRYLPLILLTPLCIIPSALNLILIIFRFEFRMHETDIQDNKKKHAMTVFFGKLLKSFSFFYNKHRTAGAVVLITAVIGGLQVLFFTLYPRMTSVYTLGYPLLAGLIFMYVLLIAADKWCLHTSDVTPFYTAVLKNLRGGLAILRLSILLTSASAAVSLTGLYNSQSILRYLLLAVWCYVSVFTVAAFIASAVKHELLSAPALHVPAPFQRHSSGLGIISYLEDNTGITMRSLWSMKLIKRVVPYALVIAFLLFWAATGIIQIESNQKGVLYRCGRLTDRLLEPGIHLTLPWPFDRTVIYDTETVRSMTVGYISTLDTDNTWTSAHGTNEYRLLLGSGDEVVSINLRIEYRIADLYKYMKNCSSPDSLLGAEAYHLVTAKTVNTDLETLLSVDRAAFAESFQSELAENISVFDSGIEIVGVILESIHPPLEVAQTYQKIIGAEIEAERDILEAQAYAAKTVAAAEAQRDTALNTATADGYTAISAANADVAEFMAGVVANGTYSGTYRYNKYLAALGKAYGNANLVIVGDGIDNSCIYFGRLTVNANDIGSR